MKSKFLKYFFLSLALFSCSKSEINNSSEEILEEEFVQIYSCVSYDDLLDPQNTNQDDLMQDWYKFVEDVKCTRDGPDYNELNPAQNIFFEYRTAAEITAGVTPDDLAYLTFTGYCNDNRVNVGVH